MTLDPKSAIEAEKKYIKQTITGEAGNCHSAVIANLLDIPIEEAWYFKRDIEEGKSWVQSLSEWAAKRGLTYLMWRADSGIVPQGFHEIHGEGGRGWGHVVLGENGNPVFDPHPDNTFLKTTEWYGKFIPCGLMLNYAITVDLSLVHSSRRAAWQKCLDAVPEKEQPPYFGYQGIIGGFNPTPEQTYGVIGWNAARSALLRVAKEEGIEVV